MATTGFWPVKSSLKEVIEYARNPDKTTNPRYLDKDLLDTLSYAVNEEKTDERLFVSGINCNAKLAYSRMMATKQRFGKLGGNVAYHGFQSFQTGEVAPEEAHQIGIETARKMWGDAYEVIVTTHLNTENLHNHIVVNSVSFKTGRKFENHISDHYKLREISDAVCLEFGKSVLKDAPFYNSQKKEYWVHKDNKLTHRDVLRKDIDEALSKTTNFRAFESYLKGLGYWFQRDMRYEHPAIIAIGWQRAVRLDRIGEKYTTEAIREQLIENQYDTKLYAVIKPRPTRSPLSDIEYELRKIARMDTINALFYIFIELLKIVAGANVNETRPQPLSPMMRQEARNLDKTLREYKLLCENHIDSCEGLVSFIADVEKDITFLEVQRNALYNHIRRPKSDKEKEQYKAETREISAKLKPLRDQLHTAKSILEHIPEIKELLETERVMETQINSNKKDRGYER